PALEIEDVMRIPKLLANAPRVVYGVERTAGPVGHVFTVTEKLHGGADDVVALLHQERCGDRRIDAARHGDQNPFPPHGYCAVANCLALATRAGKTSITRSMHSSVVSTPRLMRTAALASSGRTPIALRTWEGVTLPL